MEPPFEWYGDPAIRDWRRSFQQRYGEQPDFNDPHYNTGAAIAAGVRPAPYEHDEGMPHWPSQVARVAPFLPLPLKAENHKTRWMQTFMDQTGGVDPNEATSETLERFPAARQTANDALLRTMLLGAF